MVKQSLHLKAPGNWINDPNGFIYYQGKYHLFYQHNPYAPVWGNMHWGHAVSDDLVHWEHVGIALYPTRPEDQDGCFSGSALEQDGRLNLYYTGIRYENVTPQNMHNCVEKVHSSSQLMITSEDGFHFDNMNDKKVIVPSVQNQEIGDSKDTRDPKVWKENGIYYMVIGSTCAGKQGRVLFFKSRDGRNWDYASQYAHSCFGAILECPDLFQVEGQYVFAGSPMCITDSKIGYRDHAVCMPVEFDPGTCTMEVQGDWQYVDYGMDFYAPQTCLDKDGQRVMVGWMRMPESVESDGKKPWSGMMSLPRVVEMEDGHICFRVHPETDRYFTHLLLDMRKRKNAGKTPVSKMLMPKTPFRLKTEMTEGETLDIGGYIITIKDGYLKADRSKVFDGISGHWLSNCTPKISDHDCRCQLDIFVDENLIEIFVNRGWYVLSHVVYGLGDYIDGCIDELWSRSEL